ncbi:two pore domain potassium channel family protein [Candidatus Micrarchaeota archaeon]|nr:two pore domain potassium channel family protein [Candidatus Micrarchaeota archaeon]
MSRINDNHTMFHMIFTMFTIVLLISIGAITVHFLEGWSWIDSLYWAVMNIVTIGDTTKTPSVLTKMFAVVYVLFGVAVVLYGLLQIAAVVFKVNEDTVTHMIKQSKSLPKKVVKNTHHTIRKMKYKI